MERTNLPASAALQKLKEGNLRYLGATTNAGDVSRELREQTVTKGQRPYAVIVSCADSRVIPEAIFSAGLGELFVVRIAGNVIDDHALGSIEYAVEHLGTQLVVVMGHTHCGAVTAALHSNSGYVKSITDEIKHAIGRETNTDKASALNALHSADKIKKSLPLPGSVTVCGALYHTDTGRVDFLD